MENKARNKGIEGVRDNPFCRRTTQYPSQVFCRTTSQKSIKMDRNICIVSVYGTDYLVSICVFYNSMRWAVLLVKS